MPTQIQQGGTKEEQSTHLIGCLLHVINLLQRGHLCVQNQAIRRPGRSTPWSHAIPRLIVLARGIAGPTQRKRRHTKHMRIRSRLTLPRTLSVLSQLLMTQATAHRRSKYHSNQAMQATDRRCRWANSWEQVSAV